jgi:hypothetical protein
LIESVVPAQLLYLLSRNGGIHLHLAQIVTRNELKKEEDQKREKNEEGKSLKDPM